MQTQTLKTGCVIVGGGPAGMMAGYLMARAGVEVVVLEKHGDFLRDFRGDTIHPSTLEVLHELGLLEDFLKLPHQKTERIGVEIGAETFRVADFRHLPVKCPYIAFVPQWDFLDFLADRGRELPNFNVRMQNEARELIIEDDVVTGVRVQTPGGPLIISAGLVLAADGRRSKMRDQSGLDRIDIGAPMDVLWLRLSRHDADPAESMGAIGAGGMLAMIARGDYWQCGYVIDKGAAEALRERGLAVFRERLAATAPFLAGRLDEIRSWDDVNLLSVSVDRMTTWSRPGLLCIGDAAHAMSPVGGVGINLAIQDAVATANLLAEALKRGPVPADLLTRVQKRREFPARVTQRLQVGVQNRVIRSILGAQDAIRPPLLLRLIDKWPLLQRIPARLIGVGVRPEHVRPGLY